MADDSDSEPIVRKVKFIHDLTGNTNSRGGAVTVLSDRSSGSFSRFPVICDHKWDDSNSHEEFHNCVEEEDLEDCSDYDPNEDEFGENNLRCHSCGQRVVSKEAQCSRCANNFCRVCLRNRHGERLSDASSGLVRWICPACRGGCGLHCHNCCVCAPCRNSQGLPPTGPLVRRARAVGFTNVHDYLIHGQTRESPKTISNRKEGRGWINPGAALSIRAHGLRRQLSVKEQQPQMQSNSWSTNADRCPPDTGAASPDQVLNASDPHSEYDGKPMDEEGMNLAALRPKPRNELRTSNKAVMDERGTALPKTTVPNRNLVSRNQRMVLPDRATGGKIHRGSLEQIIGRLCSYQETESCSSHGQCGPRPSVEGIVVQGLQRNRRRKMLFRVIKRSAGHGRHKDKVDDYGDATPNLRKVMQVETEPYAQGLSMTSRMDEHTVIGSESAYVPKSALHKQARDPLVSPDNLVLFKKPVTSLQALRKFKVLAVAMHDHAVQKNSRNLLSRTYHSATRATQKMQAGKR